MVFATVHPESVDAIFSAANERGMRLYAGKVLMDRNCPAELQDTAECSYRNSKALIEKWHGMNRLGYAITPRFAPTSSEAQLEQAGRLAREHPDVHIHTHVAENLAEVRWVAELFPDARSYLDVYNRFGLVRDLSVFAHGIHLDDTDLRCLARNNAAIAFCPSSNLFIGSGLFDLTRTKSRNVCVGFGTDIGGGTSLNMLQTMADGYKVQQLLGNSLSAYQAFYLATLGGAEALHIEDRIGNFEVGKEADFTVLDCQSTPIIARLSERTIDLSDELFIQMTLGDDRAISATYLMGRLAYEREAHSQLPGILPALTNVT